MYQVCSSIFCDICGESHTMQETAMRCRKILSKEGWKNKGSLDYCDKCKKTEEAKNKISNFKDK